MNNEKDLNSITPIFITNEFQDCFEYFCSISANNLNKHLLSSFEFSLESITQEVYTDFIQTLFTPCFMNFFTIDSFKGMNLIIYDYNFGMSIINEMLGGKSLNLEINSSNVYLSPCVEKLILNFTKLFLNNLEIFLSNFHEVKVSYQGSITHPSSRLYLPNEPILILKIKHSKLNECICHFYICFPMSLIVPVIEKLNTPCIIPKLEVNFSELDNEKPFCLSFDNDIDKTFSNWIETAPASNIAKLVETEHPQVLSFIISQINEEKAVGILKNLSPKLRAEVITRISNLEPISKEVMTDIYEVIKVNYINKKMHIGGINKAIEILSSYSRVNSYDPKLQKEILKEIQNLSEETAKKLNEQITGKYKI